MTVTETLRLLGALFVSWYSEDINEVRKCLTFIESIFIHCFFYSYFPSSGLGLVFTFGDVLMHQLNLRKCANFQQNESCKIQ
jgi:hypothetical protein